MPNFGPVCDSKKTKKTTSPPAHMHACTLAHNLTIFLTHAHARTHTDPHTKCIPLSLIKKGQVSVVSDVQQPTPDDTQFAKRTSKNRRVECQTQDEKCSATDKQSDGW